MGKKCCGHIVNIENEFRNNDGLMDEAADELIIFLNWDPSE